MPTRSLENLKRLIRKMEFDKTEPELLVELIKKAREVGEGERIRLRQITKKSLNLLKVLKENNLLSITDIDENTLKKLKSSPTGAIDGSFQVTGGKGGLWYVVLGVSQIIAKKGFTLSPEIKVDGFVKPIEAIDEADSKRKAEKLMMLAEIKAMLKMVKKLCQGKDTYILIDGPIIDPPFLLDKKYIDERVNALKFCIENNATVIGFVKRVMGKNYLSFLRNTIKNKDLVDYVNDLDLLTSVLFNAAKETKHALYTKPIKYNEGLKGKRKNESNIVYETYNKKGLTIYYSYYKPNIRAKVYRVELASFDEIDEKKLLNSFENIMGLIKHVWTLPGMSEPLPIMIAHTKCNVRQGAAETLYYEIMTRAFSEGSIHLWLESS